MQWLQKCMQQLWCRSIYYKYWIEDVKFLPDKTQYLFLICPVLEAKFIFSKLDSVIESMQRIICQNLINPPKNANLIMIILIYK